MNLASVLRLANMIFSWSWSSLGLESNNRFVRPCESHIAAVISNGPAAEIVVDKATLDIVCNKRTYGSGFLFQTETYCPVVQFQPW